MQISKVVFKLQICIKKRQKCYENMLLSRNKSFIALPSIGIVACVVSCGLIAIGLIVGGIVRYVRSKKKEEETNREANCKGNHAVQKDIGQNINQCQVTKDLTTQNVNLFKNIQNTQEVMHNLNSMNNGIKIGL